MQFNRARISSKEGIRPRASDHSSDHSHRIVWQHASNDHRARRSMGIMLSTCVTNGKGRKKLRVKTGMGVDKRGEKAKRITKDHPEWRSFTVIQLPRCTKLEQERTKLLQEEELCAPHTFIHSLARKSLALRIVYTDTMPFFPSLPFRFLPLSPWILPTLPRYRSG